MWTGSATARREILLVASVVGDSIALVRLGGPWPLLVSTIYITGIHADLRGSNTSRTAKLSNRSFRAG